jgi:Animal haem peroxidase
MAKPIFFWNLLQGLFFGALALLIGFVFWLLAVVFLFLNVFIRWHRLGRFAGLVNLIVMRFIMRIRNLYDSYTLPTSPPNPDPRSIPWDPRYLYERSADGKFNDPDDPMMGSAGRRFGRNFPLTRLKVDHGNLLSPNPREVSRKLLTRDRFRPATSLNLLAAAWIQFQVHGWFNHRRSERESLPDIPVEPDDPWPEPIMKIRRTERDATRPDTLDPPTFINTETHWWDASQIYGSSRIIQEELREKKGKKLGDKLQTVRIKIGDGREELRLPLVQDKELSGIELTGFNDNWWVGISLLHTLFALEHNAICDRLRQVYPEWDDERLFQTARLINAALMAKIHTVEWTPAILGHPTVLIGLRANWWGLLTERITRNLGRIRFFKGLQEEISGIPGSNRDHHAAPYQLTEEFVSVYRMHPLIPDDYRFYSVKSDEFLEDLTFTEIQGNQTRPVMKQNSIEDLFYSFGVAYPGQITLHNFPRSLQRFQRIKDGKVRGEILDLATVDLIRDRERAIPRYNRFRELLLMLPVTSYKELVGLPLIPWFSGLTKREWEERKQWVKELEELYSKTKRLDLMVGLFAEKRPKGFGFSDTAFRIFTLMASRRLKSDRFFTDGYKPEVYTEAGMQWINENTFKSVLQRHYPALASSMADVENAFTPWRRAEPPSPEPTFAPNLFSAMPIIGGAIFGAVLGFMGSGTLSLWQKTNTPLTYALQSAAAAASVATLCLAFFYLFNDWLAREFSPRGRAAIAALSALVGAFVGSFSSLTRPATFITIVEGLATPRSVIGALIGAVLGMAVLKAVHRILTPAQEDTHSNWFLDHVIRAIIAAACGAAVGWAAGIIFHLTQVLIAAGIVAAVVDAFLVWENHWWALVGAVVGLARRGWVGLIKGGIIGWVAGAIYSFCWCFGPLVARSLVSSAAAWGAGLGAIGVAILSLLSWRGEWHIRRGFWNLWGSAKFYFARPLKISRPRRNPDDIKTKPLSEVIRGIPITKIAVASTIPPDEKWQLRSIIERFTYCIQVWLYRAFSPMQRGLPSIHSDPQTALRHAYWGLRTKKFDPPDLPPEYEGSPDLGSLAVRGPYSIYLTKVDDGEYEWDFQNLERYGHHRGLYNLGVRILFRLDDHSRLREYEIEASDLGKSRPGDPNWQVAKKLALCAATNYTSLVRHFNWIHLASGAHLAIATRNCFGGDEPLCRLLWPHIFRTQQSNYVVTRGQMVLGGDFETIFSFRHDGMCRLFEDTYQQFDFLVNDPVKDAERRGVRGNGLNFKTPTQENLENLFEVFRRHAERYLLIYYRSDGTIPAEESLSLPARGNRVLSQDPNVAKWLKDLNRLIPNGIPVKDDHVTTENLARLIASFIYLVTVQHEMLGTFLWNYQLWTHRQPVRLYRDGRREPLDVYQRLINANFNLNVKRTPLVKDYSYLALDEPGRHAFRQFERELCALDQKMKEDPWAVWKIYPKMLEVNINA